MNFQEKKLYHQIHPLKLFTDIAVTPVSLYFVWQHQVWWALGIGFLPPVLVSALMMKWPPDLERIRDSKRGQYLRKYMTPTIEAIRLLTLIPMAYGAWNHRWWLIGIALGILCATWTNGLLFPRRRDEN